MTSHNITPQGLAHWKAVCEAATKGSREYIESWEIGEAFDWIEEVRIAFPALIVAYERLLARVAEVEVLLRRAEDSGMVIAALEAEVRMLRNLSVALTEERDALRAAIPTGPQHQDCVVLLRSAWEAFGAEMVRLRNRLRDFEEDRKDTTLYRADTVDVYEPHS